MRLPSRTLRSILLILFIVALSAVAALPGSSAARAKKNSPPDNSSKAVGVVQAAPSLPVAPRLKTAGLGFTPLAFFWASFADSVSTYDAADCTTPKVSWTLGNTVCVKVSGPLDASNVLRRLRLVNPAGLVVGSVDVTTNPQTVTFTLPSDATTTFNGLINPGGDTSIDNRGTWQIISTDTSDGSVAAFASITVHDPVKIVADLQISKSLTEDSTATAGANIKSVIWVFNAGPDDAQNVSVSDATPANTTFQSLIQTAGPTFTCTTPAVNSVGTSVCQPDNMTKSLAKGDAAGFIVTYKVSSSIANGSDLNSTASVTSSTEETNAGNNSSDETVPATNTTTPTCSLTCPSNITASADTVENVDVNGVPTPTSGTHVTLPAPSATDSSCGTVSSSIPSGSFFPLGSTPVTYTAADGTSCQFLVTVTSSGSPVTISCPANVTVNADANCAATVTLGTPTTTGDGVTVTSSRSDGKPLNAPFPSGVTNVTWTATNSSGTESCTQTVTVNDIAPPVINLPAQSASADANCQAAIPDLTTNPGITDNCACDSSDSAEACLGHPHISVTQSPAAGTLVGPGPHTITLTANDGSSNNGGAGNTTTANVTFTVNDTTAPTFTFVPSSVTAYTGSGATSCDTTVNVGTATASDNCGTVNITRSPSGNTFPVGTTTVTWTATDGAGNPTTATQTVTVIDNTPPTITAPAAKTLYTGAGATSCGVTVSNLDATLGTATTNDNCGVASVVRTGVPTGGVFPLGQTTLTYTVTDVNSNTASATQVVTVVDNTPPTLVVPNVSVYLPLNSSATSMAVNYPSPTTGDNCAGTVTVVYTPASGSVFPVGTSTVSATATDAHGNTTTQTFTVTVLYNFTGFFSPVSNPPTLNVANAGRAIPVKFSLSGNKGLNIFAANSPSSGLVTCGTSTQSDVQDTTTAGNSSLSYDAGASQYNYVWKTDSSWAGQCRVLNVTLNDGTTHTALFKFK